MELLRVLARRQEMDIEVDGEDQVTIIDLEKVLCKTALQVNIGAVLHCLFCNDPFHSWQEKAEHMEVHHGEL